MRPGKYAQQLAGKRAWTADQRQARQRWHEAQHTWWALCDALHMMPDTTEDRERLHRRLDQMLDRIAAQRVEARALFPDVAESDTVATEVLRL